MRRAARHPLGAAAVVMVLAVGLLLAEPEPAAAVDLTPGFDLGIPGPTDVVEKVFEFFFKTFFGIEAKVTRRVVEWLIATPIYTNRGEFGELNGLRSYVSIAAWALFTLVFTVSAVRYYASGLTSSGSYYGARQI